MTITPPVVRTRGLGKHYGEVTALTDVDLTVRPDTIYGLLGRNGAGKTTLMQLLAGQIRPDAGTVEVFGSAPYENAEVLQQICFVADSMRYPDDMRVHHVLTSAALLLPLWDPAYANRLTDLFALPRDRKVKKLSRGTTSALGIVVGLASRAPVTVFDEPCLGLDAVARQLFYDELLADYADRPRTILVSTHLIDEVADLLERVLVLDRGRLVLDEDADRLRGRAVAASGPAADVARYVGGATVLHHRRLGGTVRTTFLRAHPDDPGDHRPATVAVEPVSLQDLVVHLHREPGTAAVPATEEVSL